MGIWQCVTTKTNCSSWPRPASESLHALRWVHCYMDELLYGFGKSQCFHFFLSHLAFWSLLSRFTPIFGLVSRGFFFFSPLLQLSLKKNSTKKLLRRKEIMLQMVLKNLKLTQSPRKGLLFMEHWRKRYSFYLVIKATTETNLNIH